VAFQQAFAGVAPLRRRGAELVSSASPGDGTPSRSVPAGGADRSRDEAGDEAARQRLASLVAGGLHFRLHEEPDGYVEGLRSDAHPAALRVVTAAHPVPEATLDLHGRTGEEAAKEVRRFVRERHQRGDRLLLIVHGKGRHSEGGRAVLGDRVRETLTRGGAAPLVLAFASAPLRLGGLGALVVRLVTR
jgi:DNA-nicking Smr family endonuclease